MDEQKEHQKEARREAENRQSGTHWHWLAGGCQYCGQTDRRDRLRWPTDTTFYITVLGPSSTNVIDLRKKEIKTAASVAAQMSHTASEGNRGHPGRQGVEARGESVKERGQLSANSQIDPGTAPLDCHLVRLHSTETAPDMTAWKVSDPKETKTIKVSHTGKSLVPTLFTRKSTAMILKCHQQVNQCKEGSWARKA